MRPTLSAGLASTCPPFSSAIRASTRRSPTTSRRRWRGSASSRSFSISTRTTGIGAGENWEKRLYEELSRCHAVILVLTPNWLASTWCRIELAQARALGKVILPIVVRAARRPLRAAGECRRSIWSTGTPAGSSGSTSGCAPSPANWRAASRCDPDRSPYPGIHAFEAEDAAIYFGRDDETPRRDRAARCAAHARAARASW